MAWQWPTGAPSTWGCSGHTWSSKCWLATAAAIGACVGEQSGRGHLPQMLAAQPTEAMSCPHLSPSTGAGCRPPRGLWVQAHPVCLLRPARRALLGLRRAVGAGGGRALRGSGSRGCLLFRQWWAGASGGVDSWVCDRWWSRRCHLAKACAGSCRLRCWAARATAACTAGSVASSGCWGWQGRRRPLWQQQRPLPTFVCAAAPPTPPTPYSLCSSAPGG